MNFGVRDIIFTFNVLVTYGWFSRRQNANSGLVRIEGVT